MSSPLHDFSTNLKVKLPTLYLTVITAAALYRLTPWYQCRSGGLFTICTGWPETVMFISSLPGIIITLILIIPIMIISVVYDLFAQSGRSSINDLLVPIIAGTSFLTYLGLGLLLDSIRTPKRQKPSTPTPTPSNTPETPH